MLEEGYSPGQDSSSVSSDESQAEPTIQTGGGFERDQPVLTVIRFYYYTYYYSVHMCPSLTVWPFNNDTCSNELSATPYTIS